MTITNSVSGTSCSLASGFGPGGVSPSVTTNAAELNSCTISDAEFASNDIVSVTPIALDPTQPGVEGVVTSNGVSGGSVTVTMAGASAAGFYFLVTIPT